MKSLSDTNRRQRKSLNGAFTNAAIRELVTIFFESGYKVRSLSLRSEQRPTPSQAKSAWDTILASSANGEAVINVQKWFVVSPDQYFINGADFI